MKPSAPTPAANENPLFLNILSTGSWSCAALFTMFILSAGCRHLSTPPPVDLTQPGWTVRQGQAVWKPEDSQAETIGDVWLATHSSGESMIEFSKAPFSLVTARRVPGQWQIKFSLEGRTANGPDPAPERFLWLHVADALADRPLPKSIETTRITPDQLQIRNRQSGEQIVLTLDQ